MSSALGSCWRVLSQDARHPPTAPSPGLWGGGAGLWGSVHRTPGTLPSTASPTRGGIPQRLRPRRRIASRASPARQAKDTSRACPSPARRRIPISGHKIPILTTGYLPPPSPGVSGAWGRHPAPGGPLLVRWQSAASGTLIITLPTTPGVSFCLRGAAVAIDHAAGYGFPADAPAGGETAGFELHARGSWERPAPGEFSTDKGSTIVSWPSPSSAWA